MKRYTKTASCFLVMMMIILSLFMNVSASNNYNRDDFLMEASDSEIQVCFEDVSSSTQEMYNKSEIVITGEVISQETQVRADMVFTMSVVEVRNIYKGNLHDEIITVLQTGGVCGDLSTSVNESSLLTVGDFKLFYLRQADEKSCQKYGVYFLILGGSQGVVDVECIQDETSVYSSTDIINPEIMPLYENPRVGQKFYKSKGIKVYILDNTGNFNAFWGFEMWTRFVGSNYVTFTEVPASSSRDIICVINDYGDTGWNGRTEWGYSGTSSLITNASIAINSSSLEQYMGNRWSDRACATIGHEVGHALGLLHPEDEAGFGTVVFDPTEMPIVASIMAKYNCTYCVEDPSIYDGVVYSTPQNYDIAAIRRMYAE